MNIQRFRRNGKGIFQAEMTHKDAEMGKCNVENAENAKMAVK
jgi:hypothetical protein